MNYFLIPGRIPLLSALEVDTVLGSRYRGTAVDSAGSEAFLLSGSLDTPALVHRLGGVIKGGRILSENLSDYAAAADAIEHDLSARGSQTGGRVTFGISAYSVSQKPLRGNAARRISSWVEKTGITHKKILRERGVSARFVTPKRGEHTLSSVVVEKNHLTHDPNVEYVLLVGDESLSIGCTEAVQEFEAYSYRDYNRPHRDMKTGLLPPKLARMMVNLASAPDDAVLLDPFCGLGTILQEAFLLGYTHVYGGDINSKNVQATKENLTWLKVGKSENIKTCDARNLTTRFQKNSIDAIVSEPTLGPTLSAQRGAVSKKEIDALCVLYLSAFRSFREVLKKNGRVVIVFPVWIAAGKHTRVPCIDDIIRLGFSPLHDPILIAREDSRVARELFVFQKTTR